MANLKRLLKRVETQSKMLEREILLTRSRMIRLRSQLNANTKFIEKWS